MGAHKQGNSSSVAGVQAGPDGPTDARHSAGEGGPGYDAGSILWHCSEEDGGPDVGIQLGLGRGYSLYCGEMPTAILEDHGIDLNTYPDGWWLVLYGPKEQWIIGAVPEPYRAQEAVEHFSVLVGAQSSEASPIVAAASSAVRP